MNFDPAGRLWVASSEVYPQIKPGQAANDKIARPRRQRRRRQGRQDHRLRRRPADPHRHRAGRRRRLRGQQHRAAAPRRTPTATARPTARRVVLSGFGTEDTHHILHTLRWGHDGHALLQPVDLHSQPHRDAARRAPAGRRRDLAVPARDDGARGLHPRALVNPWGHHFDRWGQSFATDGAGGEGINYCLPGAYYATAPDAVRHPPGAQPRQPQVLRARDRQRPAPARRLAGQPAHQRLPRQPRLPVRGQRRRRGLRRAASRPS